MPRPTRTRRTRRAAQPAPAVASSPQPSPDMIPDTPLKPTEAMQPDSSEKENRPQEKPAAPARLSTGNLQQRRVMADATRRRDSALRSLEAEDFTTSSIDDDLLDMSEPDIERGRRAGAATPSFRGRRDASGLVIDEDIFSSMYSDGLEPPSSRGRSAHTSTLSVGQFKRRRSRAPSIVSRDGGSIRPSSRGLNTPGVSSTFNFGQFRRRAREPSILGRRSRRETQTTEVTGQSASEAELEDFMPDAVSTPLERRRTRASMSAQHAAPASSTSTRSRKRKSVDTEHAESDRPEKTSRVEQEEEEQAEVEDPEDEQASNADNDDLESVSDESLPSPGSIRAVEARPTTPANEEIMAPPASTGSESSPAWPSIHELARRRRRMSPSTPLHAGFNDNASDMSSPPSLTHSPNFTAAKKAPKIRGRKGKAQPIVHLTSDLASLLPQRRRNQRNAQDDESGDESDASVARGDEDELAYSRGTRRRRGSRSGGRAGTARPSSRAGARGRPAPGGNGRVRQTYGSRADDADDSFAPLPDDSFADGPAEVEDPKEELKNAVKKFKEVDKWELEFEEAVESSSSQDGR